MLGLAIAAVTVRVGVKFDLNVWLENRRADRDNQALKKIVENCRHIWTLYTDSPYSKCDICGCFISTSILLRVKDNPDCLINGYANRLMITPSDGFRTGNYIGKKAD